MQWSCVLPASRPASWMRALLGIFITIRSACRTASWQILKVPDGDQVRCCVISAWFYEHCQDPYMKDMFHQGQDMQAARLLGEGLEVSSCWQGYSMRWSETICWKCRRRCTSPMAEPLPRQWLWPGVWTAGPACCDCILIIFDQIVWSSATGRCRVRRTCAA